MARPAVTHVVWDWNGTLLDDLACSVGVANRLLAEFGLPTMSDAAQYRSRFRFPIVDYYADLGFDTSPGGNFTAAAQRYVELYRAASAACGLHADAEETLSALHAAGVRQVVISASQQSHLDDQMAPFGLHRWVDSAHGLDDIYAASKERLARRWIADEGVDPARVLFVGDSEHDFEIADAVGAACALVGHGHHAPEHLSTLGVPVLDGLQGVLTLV
jgi:phosphoglycolate phosphatase